MDHFCSNCKKEIPEKVFNYSKDNFDKILCRDCQKSVHKEKKEKSFYYNPETMYLNELKYPVYKKSNFVVHKYVAEKYMRKLNRGEVVHHVDGDKLNYHINNLVILSKEDHKKIEKELRLWKNWTSIYFLVILFAIISLIPILGYGDFFSIIAFIFLVFGIIISTYPKTLRKFLFKCGFLESNKKK